MIETSAMEPGATLAPNDPLLLEVSSLIVLAVNIHHLDPAKLGANTSLREGGLDLDSIDVLEVIVAVEQRYGFKISDAEIGKKVFRTLGSITEFVRVNRTV